MQDGCINKYFPFKTLILAGEPDALAQFPGIEHPAIRDNLRDPAKVFDVLQWIAVHQEEVVKMTERVDLRADPFVFFHVSNGYLAASNPGMDELATKFGISYHLGNRSGSR